MHFRGSVDLRLEILTRLCLQYAQDDVVMKSGNCKHWLHKGCLEVCPFRLSKRPKQVTDALVGLAMVKNSKYMPCLSD